MESSATPPKISTNGLTRGPASACVNWAFNEASCCRVCPSSSWYCLALISASFNLLTAPDSGSEGAFKDNQTILHAWRCCCKSVLASSDMGPTDELLSLSTGTQCATASDNSAGSSCKRETVLTALAAGALSGLRGKARGTTGRGDWAANLVGWDGPSLVAGDKGDWGADTVPLRTGATPGMTPFCVSAGLGGGLEADAGISASSTYWRAMGFLHPT